MIFETVNEMISTNLQEGQIYSCKRYHDNGEILEGLHYVGVNDADIHANGFGNHPSQNGIVAKLLVETESVNVKHLGIQSGDSIDNSNYNNKDYLQGALDYIQSFSLKPILNFPSGVYNYSSSPNFGIRDLIIKGAGKQNTILKNIGTESQAFKVGRDVYEALIFGVELHDFTVEGNSNNHSLIYTINCSHLVFSNLNAVYSDQSSLNYTENIGFDFHFTVLSKFENLTCSVNEEVAKQSGRFIPKLGIYLRNSIRSGANSFSSANLFLNPIIEGCDIGLRIDYSDQNTFVGGTFEACNVYGVILGNVENNIDRDVKVRYNTFIGVGLENKDAIADIYDNGTTNKFINCYASKQIIINNAFTTIDGGIHHRITINKDAKYTTLKDLKYNNWESDGYLEGGIFDNGKQSTTKRLINSKTGEIYDSRKPRQSVTITSTDKHTYKNENHYPVQLVIVDGDVTTVQFKRASLQSNNADIVVIGGANSQISVNNIYFVLPNDEVIVHFNTPPYMYTIPFTW